MDAFSRFGTNFHEREGRFFFDPEENEHAKVELEAVKLNDETARAEAVRIWQRDVFRDTRHSVVFQDPATTQQALDALDRKPPPLCAGLAAGCRPRSATVSTWAWSAATRCFCWSHAITA